MSLVADRALAKTDASAVKYNCELLKSKLQNGAKLCAVVKANGYGHGDVWCAQAAVAGGAQWLAVATASEAENLRHHHLETPILVMGALTHEEIDTAVRVDADITIWNKQMLDAVIKHSSELESTARVHLKFDSGMGRLGTNDPKLLTELAQTAAKADSVELIGLMTHFATADEQGSDYVVEQLDRFGQVVKALKANYPELLVHAANSAATLAWPQAHFDMVRCGIAIYGMDPFHSDPTEYGLKPALSLYSYVAEVKLIEPGESVGYGRKWSAQQPTWIAVLPIGYGDGVRRALSNRGELLIGGKAYPICGTVSMDNITIELGNEPAVSVGDQAVLIGEQSGKRILAEKVANSIDTINYEISCGISGRVKRLYHR